MRAKSRCRPKRTAKECYVHFCRRWNERFPELPAMQGDSDKKFHYVKSTVGSGRAKFVSQDEVAARKAYALIYKGTLIEFIFDEKLRTPVTIYQPTEQAKEAINGKKPGRTEPKSRPNSL